MTASATRPATRAHLSIAASFLEAGGAGDLDMYGRVVVGPSKYIIQGDPAAWLLLVAHGLVAGENGRVMLTAHGRDMAQSILDGRVRASA